MTLPTSLDDLRGLRAARWVRESTGGQFDTFGPEAQREQQDRAIERYGLAESGLSWVVAHSGRTVGKTPQFADMLARAGSEFDVLVVGYVSRFARDLRTAVNARHDLHAAGAAICSAMSGCSARTRMPGNCSPAKRSRPRPTAAASPSASARATPRSSADWPTQAGGAPFGFLRVGSAHTLAIDPATIGQAVHVFERYATGTLSIDAVAAEAGLAGTGSRAMLANPIYNGWARRYRRSRREEQATHSLAFVAARQRRPVGARRARPQSTNSRPRCGPPAKVNRSTRGAAHCVCGRRIRANGTAGSPPKPQRLHPGSCGVWRGSATVWSSMHSDPIAAQLAGIRLDDVTIARVVNALGGKGTPAPVAADSARIERRKRDLALDHAADRIDDEHTWRGWPSFVRRGQRRLRRRRCLEMLRWHGCATWRRCGVRMASPTTPGRS